MNRQLVEDPKGPVSSTVDDALRCLIEMAPVATVLLGPDGRMLHANEPFRTLVGRPSDQRIDGLLGDLLLSTDGRPVVQEAIGSGSPIRLYARQDGSRFAAVTGLTILSLDAAGAPTRSLMQVIEVRAEPDMTAIAQQDADWRQALLSAGQEIWDNDIEAGTLWMSSDTGAAADLVERELTSVEERIERIHPDDRARMVDDICSIREGATEEVDSVYRRRSPNGDWRWILARGRVVRKTADGRAARIIGTNVDISREKAIEAELAAATERLEIALEAGNIGIYDTDEVAGTLNLDERTCALHGVAVGERDWTRDAWLRLLHPDDASRISDYRASISSSGTDFHRLDYRVVDPKTGNIRHLRTATRTFRAADGALQRSVGICWDVTDQARREIRMQEMLALLDAVMAGTPELIYAKDLDGRYLFANASVERLMGRSSAEIVGRHDREIFSAEIAEPLVENDQHVIATRTPFNKEELAYLDGDLRIYSSTKAPYRNASGAIIGVMGISRDITDARKAEAELRKSEGRWQFALDGSGDGIWDWHMPSGEVFFSRQWKAMLGFDDDEVGTTVAEWSDRVHPDDLERCRAIIEQHFRGESSYFTFEHRMRAKDGTWRWILDRGKVIERSRDGQPIRVIGTHTDVTERKENEQKILALNERLQIAIEAAGAGVFDLDVPTGRFRWGDRMYALYDLPPDRYDGTLEGWVDFIHPEDVPRVLDGYSKALDETLSFSMDFRIRRQRSGEIRHIRSLARVICDDAGRPVRALGMNWDITDDVELADALFEEKERLRITLHSIGDSVISTDAKARIIFMNPVAEQMTGWPADDALGRPLREIFHIVDEATGIRLPDPVKTCLDRMTPYRLELDAVLVGRNDARCNVRASAAPVLTVNGDVIGAVLVFQDVTRARALQRALEHSASHDSMTGLPNRAAFERSLREVRALGQGAYTHILCFIDLDRFKIVNDNAGHAAGDALLRSVANLLRGAIRTQDVASRLGGDEFALLLRDCDIEEGRLIAERCLRSLSDFEFIWDDLSYQVGASIGLTRIGPDNHSLDEVMSQADIACYTAKTGGRNQIAIYGDVNSDAHRHHREIQIAARIRNAIETGRFRLYAQEVHCLRASPGSIRHFEILLRMVGDRGQIIAPVDFIPAAERYDLMGSIDRWVIRTLCRHHGAALRAARDIAIAVNLSANSLNDPLLWQFIREELGASGLTPTRFNFEITETAAINNLTAAKDLLANARAAGCGVILDDFGAGLSSFTYLREFPVDGIKIDGGFIRHLTKNPVDQAIVESINALGHRLGAVTAAEQVEDEATLKLLREIGIDRAQGFVLGHPQPFENIF